MTGRVLVVSGALLWAGATLLLSQLRWFARRPLIERLAPYTAGGPPPRTYSNGSPARRGSALAEVIGPAAGAMGERIARLFGVSEALSTRLRRVHSPLDVAGIRLRQLGWAVAAFGTGCLMALAFGPPIPVGLLLVLGGPLLAFLIVEQRVASASATWQRRLTLELPVVAEQLAMLLNAGYSLSAALGRIARRGRGACAADINRVISRVRQGLSTGEALREWADLAQVDAVSRLVAILALDHEADDLGRLISDEARSVRRDVQRGLVEIMERRGQQVWIPVTVATLVPGVIFLSIPFIEALRLFAGS